MTSPLHVPEVLDRTAHEVAHEVASVTHQVAGAAHHVGAAALHEVDALADVVVDVLLAPLAPELADLHIEVTEDDVL